MTSLRRICVVTGTRADYGLLVPPMRLIRDDPALDLQIIITGMHLSTEYGFTYRRIEQDGFSVAARVDCQQRGDDISARGGTAVQVQCRYGRYHVIAGTGPTRFDQWIKIGRQFLDSRQASLF